jgi:hypothetical protein
VPGHAGECTDSPSPDKPSAVEFTIAEKRIVARAVDPSGGAVSDGGEPPASGLRADAQGAGRRMHGRAAATHAVVSRIADSMPIIEFGLL